MGEDRANELSIVHRCEPSTVWQMTYCIAVYLQLWERVQILFYCSFIVVSFQLYGQLNAWQMIFAVATLYHRQRSKRCTVVRLINRKMGNSTPCKIVTPKTFLLKLCTRNYVGEVTRHANFIFNRYSGSFSPDKRNITTLCLSLPFFSILRPGRTAWPIFTFYGSNDVFPRKDGSFGG